MGLGRVIAYITIILLPLGVALASPSPAEIDEQASILYRELRCMVCQGQSLYDSHVPLAEQMKKHIRKELEAGKSETQIKAELADRYGRSILMEPPVMSDTWLLWAGPVLFLLVGGLFIWRRWCSSAA